MSLVSPEQIETRLTLAFRPRNHWEAGKKVALQYFNQDGSTSFVFGILKRIDASGIVEVDVSDKRPFVKCHVHNLWAVAESRETVKIPSISERIFSWLSRW
jgi:hypothetical protein